MDVPSVGRGQEESYPKEQSWGGMRKRTMRFRKKMEHQARPAWLWSQSNASYFRQKEKGGDSLSPETRKCQHGCLWGSGAISAPQLPCGYPSHNSTSLPGIPSNAPGQDLVWPAWSCVHPGANHMVAQSGGSADWLGLWDTPLRGGVWQDHWGACWPALEVGAHAAAGGASGQGPRASEGAPRVWRSGCACWYLSE